MSLQRLAHAVHGQRQGADVTFQGVSTDTRTMAAGELFIALIGARFDGHEFVQEAAQRGAAAALISHPIATDLPSVMVQDTTQALGQLGSYWRGQFDIPLIAVTGSNGKTTVKEMIGAILRQRHACLVSAGNLNNAIGVPLSLCQVRSKHRYAVIEMGMNHSGEIAYLTRLAQPNVALITNAAAAHLEGLGDVASVARAKGEIFGGLAADGTAIINADDPYAPVWRDLAAGHRCIQFGLGPDADVTADFELTPGGSHIEIWTGKDRFSVDLRLPGRHNVSNALAATAATTALDIDSGVIQAGLSMLRPVPGRLAPVTAANGALLYDDSYNANPASVRAGIEVLAAAPGLRILVLGDMAELGPSERALHAEIGLQARAAGIEHLYGLGPLSAAAVQNFGPGGHHFEDIESLQQALQQQLTPKARVLIKGSRRMGMERIVAALAPVKHKGDLH